ncbi:MAG: M4 family metallopeptidase, partial [Bacteroidota bacterium]
MKRIILLLYLCACSSCMFAQLEDHLSYAEGGYYEFSEDSEISPEGFFEKFAPELGLGKEDEMRIFRQNEDDLGNLHIIYQRFYKGIKVEGNTFALHTKNGIVFSANGKLTDKLSGSTLPRLSEQEARDLAIRSVNSELFAWESAEWEESLRIEEGSEASYFPQGELLIVKEEAANRYRLAWKFEIKSLLPYESWDIIISAKSGQILDKIPRIFHCNSYRGSASTLYNGLQSLELKDRFFARGFYLEDCTRDIETRVYQHSNLTPRAGVPGAWSNIPKVDYGYANWGTNHQIESSAQWAAEKSWDYLDRKLNWQGLDGNGRRMRILTQVYNFRGGRSAIDSIARFDADKEVVLLGALGTNTNNRRDLVSLQIVGHELFHSVVINTANLTIKGESGSLHEGYCDLFGLMLDKSIRGQVDWNHGSDVSNNPQRIRAWESPNDFEDPAMVGDDFYRTQNCGQANVNNNFCWVHENSTILGRCFNLLSGSSRPNQNGVFVPGIGIEKAFDIAWRALKYGYLSKDTKFQDARAAWTLVARQLYGKCSSEAYSVKMAWAAVGIGSKQNLCTELQGAKTLLDCPGQSSLGNFMAIAPVGSQIQWLVPTNWDYQISGRDGQNFKLISLPSGVNSGNVRARVVYRSSIATDQLNFTTRPCLQHQREGTINSVLLYPNPAGNFVILKVEEELLGANLSLYNSKGLEVLSSRQELRLNKISLEDISPGIYFFNLSKGGRL